MLFDKARLVASLTLVTLGCFTGCEPLGGGRIPPPLLLRTMNGLTKKI